MIIRIPLAWRYSHIVKYRLDWDDNILVQRQSDWVDKVPRQTDHIQLHNDEVRFPDGSCSTFAVLVVVVCVLGSHLLHQVALLHGSGDLPQLKEEALLLVSTHPLHPARRSTELSIQITNNTLSLMQAHLHIFLLT